MKHFRLSIVVTVICLALAYVWGLNQAAGGLGTLMLALILGVMEVSLSFDNAVVNASVLKEMDAKWRRLFLTVGMLIAVFGMRLIFPVVIVSIATSQSFLEVTQMALSTPDEYARHLTDSHTGIAAFGGVFLLLVFLSYMLDAEKETHWLGFFEKHCSSFGKVQHASVIVALLTLLAVQALMPLSQADRLTFLLAGLAGILLYVAVDGMGGLFEDEDQGENFSSSAKRSGVMGFIYLEILDASFSFDGVIGAFAITRDIVVIMLGLTIGAMFVRSLTVYLVEKGTLDEYVYLEHGAHYGIGALAAIMLCSITWHISEVVTGLIGVSFIIAAVLSSIVHKRQVAAEV